MNELKQANLLHFSTATSSHALTATWKLQELWKINFKNVYSQKFEHPLRAASKKWYFWVVWTCLLCPFSHYLGKYIETTCSIIIDIALDLTRIIRQPVALLPAKLHCFWWWFATHNWTVTRCHFDYFVNNMHNFTNNSF